MKKLLTLTALLSVAFASNVQARSYYYQDNHNHNYNNHYQHSHSNSYKNNRRVAEMANPQLQRADKNKDGLVSKREFKRYIQHKVVKADRNHDGVVTRGEYKRIKKKSRGAYLPKFSKLDKNNDRVITFREGKKASKRIFNKLDRNNDGYVRYSRKSYKPYKQKRVSQYKHRPNFLYNIKFH